MTEVATIEVTDSLSGHLPAHTSVDYKEDIMTSIRKQVEFYFSDSNLPRDRFLSKLINETEGGWIPISVISSFNRIKKFNVDVTFISKALRLSSLLEVSEDDLRVRRTTSLPLWDEQLKKVRDARTIYAKGFPKDGTTIDSVENLFSPFGVVQCVRLRRFPSNRLFKGSVFVEFSSETEAKNALELKLQLEEDKPLLVMMKQAYLEKKQQEWEERRTAKETKRCHLAEDDEEMAEKKLLDDDYPKDCIIMFENVTNETSREDLRAYFEKTCNASVTYVDFRRGETSGYLRLSPSGASEAVQKLQDAQAMVNGVIPNLRVLEGDEERNYWKKVYGLIAAKRKGKYTHYGGNMKRCKLAEITPSTENTTCDSHCIKTEEDQKSESSKPEKEDSEH
jgi:lupus La protein